MRTYGAYFGRLFADDDMTAVGALPNDISIFGEYKAALNVGDQLAIALFMLFFDFADGLEEIGDAVEALFFCFFGKFVIHIGPFVIFAGGRIFKVCKGIRYFTPVQQLEPDFCMLLLIVCRFLKNFCNLDIAVLFFFLGVIGIFISRLRFARERRHQICFCSRSFQFHHPFSFIKISGRQRALSTVLPI